MPSSPAPKPLSERDILRLQQLLDQVPAGLEPLDVSMLDGFLCGVLLQPRLVPETQWLPHVTDADGKLPPAGWDPSALHALVRRRHAELNHAIEQRLWFDPWVFELEDEDPQEQADDPEDDGEDDDDQSGSASPAMDAVYPWVAGFATAMELFPALMQSAPPGEVDPLIRPLSLLYRYLSPDDLEDAQALLDEIDTLEPPMHLAEAVEDLVQASLLLADIGRPRRFVSRGQTQAPGRRGAKR